MTMTAAVSPQKVDVAILGAGFGGLAMAIRLQQEGRSDYVLLEKGDNYGGTWRENTYPGAACDVQSHMYSLSFAPKTDWSKRYAPWNEIQDYILDTARTFDLDARTRFGAEVVSAIYQPDTARWLLSLADGSQVDCRVFVLASGPLHVPSIPSLRGIDSFKGEVFHSAHWNHDIDLTGKNVVSIGTGGSAIQYVPEIAPQVKQLYVLQRTAAWVIPRDERHYHALEKKLFARLPLARQLHRARLYWSNESRVVPILRPRIVRHAQKLVELFIRYQVKDQALAKKLTPDYVMGCKRILISNKYFPTFNRPNVELVTEGIAEVRPHSVLLRDGRELPADVIIYGTGFITDPRIYMKNFKVTGLPDHDLSTDWKDGAESYYGISTAGFPNLFQLVGPNTTLGHNSIIFMIEAQVNYILDLLKKMDAKGIEAVDVRDEIQQTFNARVQKQLEGTVWSSGCVSWYQQEGGKNFALWPTYTWKYWLETRKARLSDYRPIQRGQTQAA